MKSTKLCSCGQKGIYICSRCKIAYYCSRKCQFGDWKRHKKDCTTQTNIKFSDGKDLPAPPRIPAKPSPSFQDGKVGSGSTQLASQQDVIGVKIFPTTGMATKFVGEAHKFTTSNPIFSHGQFCPFTDLYGIPILLHSPSIQARQDADENNQIAVYLRIEPDDGLAPFEWQFYRPGTCFAVRKDSKPLTPELLETMFWFHKSLLGTDYFEKTPQRRAFQITPKRFQDFSKKYWKEQTAEGRVMPDLML